jgi:uncharacterized protein (UPF0276 family)
MSQLPSFLQGVGVTLRLDHIDAILDTKPKLPYLEIITENWFSDGPHHKKLEKLREDYNILFHCVGMNFGGLDSLDDNYFKKVKELSDKFQPYHISDHLCFQKHNNRYHHDLLPFPFNEESLVNISGRVNKAQELLERTLLIENLSYYVEFSSTDISEVDFINELLNRTNANMLLDLNNIWVNQKNLDLDCKDYLEKINWERVKEVHVAGPEILDGIYIDTHGTEVHEDVLKLIDEQREKLQNLPITYERDNNIPPLDELLNQVQILNERVYGGFNRE